MKNKKNKIIVISFIAVALAAAATTLMLNQNFVEKVKQETAKILVYEYIPSQNVNLDSCLASLQCDSIYKDFRKKYRFHYQTIGFASFSDSSRFILLSDLPPQFELDSIASIFSGFAHRVDVRRHGIGYDGFVTDVLICLGNATRENCDLRIKRLNKSLFYSDYKPAITSLPVSEKRQYFAKQNIDYQISLNEFNTWFIEDGESFFDLKDTTMEMTIMDMFDQQQRGVFFSVMPGFVAWSIAKNTDLSEQLSSIRQFTLDADLILGALADDSTLVVIGRERQSPLNELPPLQIETILLLASTTEKELSQSLDINDFMAGKMNDGRDWCPTYLSRELENTEFGDLMTMTDILLKDWSERGTIKEGNYSYPKPGYYPFDRPLFRKLGLNELVYNWNTADAMYAIDLDGYTIYTLNRTGSLPVSYFNSQERSESIGYRYESQAYHYFATLMNTDLARVVQYTALYQLFIDNNITYSGETYSAFPKNKPFLLCQPTTELLNIFKNLTAEQIVALSDSLSHRSFNNFQKEQVDKQLRDNESQYNFTYTDDRRDFIYQDVHKNTKSGFISDLTEMKNLLNSLDADHFKKLAKYLSYPRGITINSQEKYNTMMQGRKINRIIRMIGKNNFDLLGLDLKDVKNYFVGNLSKQSGKYMKTPSIIITFNDLLTTGGHNLSSRISRVGSMTNYKRSKGNYVPKDYERPVEDEPVDATQPTAKESAPAGKPVSSPTSSQPRASSPGSSPSSSGKPAVTAKPSVSRPTSSGSGSLAPGVKSTTVTKSSGTAGVRSRSSVISAAPRSQRGF
ncbi:MAG: hypothetical protein MJZ72_06885 [Bacteroidales bacterium]|nr:hypothetical protein [Bacteroidales bacterium]